MKLRKQLLAGMVAAVLALAGAACSSDTTDTDTEGGTSASETST